MIGRNNSFKDDLNRAFEVLAQGNKFDFYLPNLYSLNLGRCIIVIVETEDGHDINFKRPGANDLYHWVIVYEAIYNSMLFPLIEIPPNVDRNSYAVLETEVELLDVHFKNVLNGDFSWAPKYLEILNEERILIQYISSREGSRDAQRLFFAQDPNWKNFARLEMKGKSK